MKLPFSNPRTSKSPSRYASVISSPSSATRRAIVSSSYAMRFSARPESLGSAADVVTPVPLRSYETRAALQDANSESSRLGSRPIFQAAGDHETSGLQCLQRVESHLQCDPSL